MADSQSAAPLVVHIDVTDTVRAAWRAGIQRVVVQLVEHLRDREDIEVVPVVWLDTAGGFRRLTEDEHRSITPGATDAAVPSPAPQQPAEAPPPGPVRTLRRWLRPVRRAGRWLLDRSGARPVLVRLRSAVLLRTRDRRLRPLVVRPGRGSVLLELDSVWNVVEVDRDRLYRRLRESGVRIAVLVYDLLPLEHPDWFEESLVEVFSAALGAQLRHAELLLAISHDTARSVSERGPVASAPVEVVALGADVVSPRSGGVPAVPDRLAGARYVLVVGTVEPRKNHRVLLDAFDRLAVEDPDLHLVVVGRAGWNNDEVVDRLRRHPLLDERLHWYEGAGDELLGELYRGATVVAVPSISEGFGLPVIEALAAGVPVVCSNGGALPEAGGDLVDLVDPDDPVGLAAALGRLLDDPEELEHRRRDLVDYEPPTWSRTAAELADALLRSADRQ